MLLPPLIVSQVLPAKWGNGIDLAGAEGYCHHHIVLSTA